MLVTFASHGDRLGFVRSEVDHFTISGRFGAELSADSGTNLLLRARDLLRDAVRDRGGDAPPVHIHLEKNLPIASGIGGGSADAAATLRGLRRLWSTALTPAIIAAIAIKLGADVPMCLKSRPLLARGIGEKIAHVEQMPPFAIVLANPLTGVSTPEVFRKLATKSNPPLVLSPQDGWIETIRGMRNDLEQPARELLPEIGVISAMLEEEGALLVRMSGSGATCFGIFESNAEAEHAGAALHRRRPDWYFQVTETLAGGK
jgi:4-diphosphocytidyl-2-C-methyl-D-erythritol kinase